MKRNRGRRERKIIVIPIALELGRKVQSHSWVFLRCKGQVAVAIVAGTPSRRPSRPTLSTSIHMLLETLYSYTIAIKPPQPVFSPQYREAA